MPSRRTAIRAGGLAVAAPLGGCLSGGDTAGDRTGTTPGDGTDADERTDSDDGRTTDDANGPRVRVVDPDSVPDGASVVPAAEDLRSLVASAAETDGRVDLDRQNARRDDSLVFEAFEYLRYDGETYEPTTSFAGFAQEATFTVEASETATSEVDDEDDVIDYDGLNGSEREIADRLVDGERYVVGGHDEIPGAFYAFEFADVLRIDDDVSRLSGLVADNAPHHMLALEPADPAPDERVVTVADRALPDATREPVRSAVTDGPVDLTADEAGALRDSLDRSDYVLTATTVVAVTTDGD